MGRGWGHSPSQSKSANTTSHTWSESSTLATVLATCCIVTATEGGHKVSEMSWSANRSERRQRSRRLLFLHGKLPLWKCVMFKEAWNKLHPQPVQHVPQKPHSPKPLPSYSNTARGAERLLVNTDVLIPVFKINIKNTEMRCFFPHFGYKNRKKCQHYIKHQVGNLSWWAWSIRQLLLTVLQRWYSMNQLFQQAGNNKNQFSC